MNVRNTIIASVLALTCLITNAVNLNTRMAALSANVASTQSAQEIKIKAEDAAAKMNAYFEALIAKANAAIVPDTTTIQNVLDKGFHPTDSNTIARLIALKKKSPVLESPFGKKSHIWFDVVRNEAVINKKNITNVVDALMTGKERSSLSLDDRISLVAAVLKTNAARDNSTLDRYLKNLKPTLTATDGRFSTFMFKYLNANTENPEIFEIFLNNKSLAIGVDKINRLMLTALGVPYEDSEGYDVYVAPNEETTVQLIKKYRNYLPKLSKEAKKEIIKFAQSKIKQFEETYKYTASIIPDYLVEKAPATEGPGSLVLQYAFDSEEDIKFYKKIVSELNE